MSGPPEERRLGNPQPNANASTSQQAQNMLYQMQQVLQLHQIIQTANVLRQATAVTAEQPGMIQGSNQPNVNRVVAPNNPVTQTSPNGPLRSPLLQLAPTSVNPTTNADTPCIVRRSDISMISEQKVTEFPTQPVSPHGLGNSSNKTKKRGRPRTTTERGRGRSNTPKPGKYCKQVLIKYL